MFVVKAGTESNDTSDELLYMFFKKGETFSGKKKKRLSNMIINITTRSITSTLFSLPDHIFCVMVSVGQGSIVKKKLALLFYLTPGNKMTNFW